MANSIPPRDNRVLQTVGALKANISSGKLRGDLPGEAALAKSLSVSRVTLRKALQLLEEEKLLSSTSRGYRRRVLCQPSATEPEHGGSLEGKMVVTFSPQSRENLPAIVRLYQARIQAHCAGAGMSHDLAVADLSKLRRPGHRLSEFVKQNPADVYLLLLSTQEIQQWFDRQGIATIVLGTTWPDCSLPCVDVDLRAIGLHAAQMFYRTGHHKVGFLFPQPVKQGIVQFIEGFSSFESGVELVMADQDDSPESILKALHGLIDSPDRPSAIILPRIPYVMTAVSYLPTVGLKVPEAVSLLSLVYDSSFEFYYPNIAGYRIDHKQAAKKVLTLIQELLLYPDIKLSRRILLMPDFIQGESLASL